MAESEEELLARVAKHNGTTVEFEREQSLRRKLGAKDVDDNSIDAIAARRRAAMNASPGERDETAPTLEPASTTAVRQSEAANPFSNALTGIYVISFLIGLILVGVGAGNAGSYEPGEFSDHPDNGVAWIIWGGSFLSLGITAAMVHLGALAVIWQVKRSHARGEL